MQAPHSKTETKPRHEEFFRRLDFYWQFIVAYFIAFLLYSFLKGSIDEGTLTITFKDPVVILLALFIVVTGISLMVDYYKKASIIVGKDFIIFKSRFKEKKYGLHEIQRIALGRERIINVKSSFRLIKLRVAGRRRIIRIRPTSYLNENELLTSIVILKRALNK